MNTDTRTRHSREDISESLLASATFEITIQDVEYACHDGMSLLARLYVPHGPGPFPLIAEVHGGAWCRGDRLDEDKLNQALARRGVVVAALDFRMPPQAAYPASIADINLAVRWLKSTAGQWRSREDLIGLMGLSSGGHQAMLAAMRPNDRRYAALPLQGGSAAIDATAAFVVMCWPVIDPLGRYHYAREWKASGRPYPEAIDRVIPDHIRYWGDEHAMDEGSPARILENGTAGSNSNKDLKTPPVLYLQGENDLVHPRAHLERFVSSYREAGGEVALRWFADEAEGFANKKPDSPSTTRAIDEIVQFVQSRTHLAFDGRGQRARSEEIKRTEA